jgi:hypothetical protein
MTLAEKSEPAFHFPEGVVVSRTGLIIGDEVSDQDLHRAFSQTAKMEKSVAWWIGDLGIAIAERKRAPLVAKAAELRDRAKNCTDDEDGLRAARELRLQADRVEGGQVEYARELAEAHGLNSTYIRDCVMLCRAIPGSSRTDTLTPKHHHAALKAAGTQSTGSGLTKAVEWLNVAESEKLTAAALRKRVNQSLAEVRDPIKPAEENPYKLLDAADSWCIHNASTVYAKAVAANMLVRWQALVALVDNLRKCADAK